VECIGKAVARASQVNCDHATDPGGIACEHNHSVGEIHRFMHAVGLFPRRARRAAGVAITTESTSMSASHSAPLNGARLARSASNQGDANRLRCTDCGLGPIGQGSGAGLSRQPPRGVASLSHRAIKDGAMRAIPRPDSSSRRTWPQRPPSFLIATPRPWGLG
jgi:hypothetical protein